MVLGAGSFLLKEMLKRRKKKKKKKLTSPEVQGPAPTMPSQKSEPKINYLDPMPKIKPKEGGPKPAPMPNQPKPKKGKEKFREVPPKAKKKKGKKEDKKPEIISVKDGGMLTKTVSSKRGSNSQGTRGTGAAIRGTKFKGVF